jgi:NAD(P)-dependent dehydrogenase (short-subunit alcohol dehydrogenase family)
MKKSPYSEGKSVFISGAAGGLGKVLVRYFADNGYLVIAADIDISGISSEMSPGIIMPVRLDVTRPEMVRSVLSDLDLDKKGLDILVCLAGIYDTYPVTEADPGLFKKIIDVNLLGAAALVQGFLKAILKKQGRIIVVTSESYKIQAMFQPYMISKAALEAYCSVARQELALKGIRLITIRPGAIRTPLLNWMNSAGEKGKYTVFNNEYMKSREKSLKMVGRISDPAVVARKIYKASTVKRPRRIYKVNNNPVLSLVSILPTALIEWVMIRMMRSGKKG